MTIDKRKTGVYRIRNLINDKKYVGSAGSSFSQRWKDHRRHLRKGTHHSAYLQNSWNKYGEDAFVFEIIERTAPEHAVAVEQTFIDFWKATDPQYGYNVCPTAGSRLGYKQSQDMKDKIAAANNQRYLDPVEHERSSESQRVRWADEDARAAQSAALKEHWSDTAVRDEMSRKAIARLSSPEARKKASDSAKKRYQDPQKLKAFLELMASNAVRTAMSEAHQDISDETRSKMSIAHKANWANPDYRAKMLAARAAGHARRKAAALAAQQESPDANP